MTARCARNAPRPYSISAREQTANATSCFVGNIGRRNCNAQAARACGLSTAASDRQGYCGAGWTDITATEKIVDSWARQYPDAHNTGALTRHTPVVDIDVTDAAAADAIEALAREQFAERGHFLVRFGKAPKRAIPLSTDKPFKKIKLALAAPNGSKAEIEILGDGQQFIVDGKHPETQLPYRWHGGELWTIPPGELPHVSEEQARQFLHDAEKLLVEQFGTRRSPRRLVPSMARPRPTSLISFMAVVLTGRNWLPAFVPVSNCMTHYAACPCRLSRAACTKAPWFGCCRRCWRKPTRRVTSGGASGLTTFRASWPALSRKLRTRQRRRSIPGMILTLASSTTGVVIFRNFRLMFFLPTAAIGLSGQRAAPVSARLMLRCHCWALLPG